jgi:hypothetical protein
MGSNSDFVFPELAYVSNFVATPFCIAYFAHLTTS